MSIKLCFCRLTPGLVEALVDGACDREAPARDAIFKSLADIGRRKHKVVLEITHSYLTKHNKVSRMPGKSRD